VAALKRGGLALFVLLEAHCGARSDLGPATAECLPGEAEPCEIAQGPGARECDARGHWGVCAAAGPVIDGSGGRAGAGTGSGSPSGGTGASDGVGGTVGSSGTAGGTAIGGGSAGVAGGASGGSGGNAPLTCAEGAEHEFYVITPLDVLYRIEPDTLEILSEAMVALQDLNSLALAADGTLYAGSWYGELDTIDVASATIEHQPFDPYQYGNNEGVCIGWADALPQAQDGALLMSMDGQGLYAVDRTTFELATLGNTSGVCEVVGDPNGRLFGLGTNAESSSAAIYELDTSAYQLIDEIVLPGATWASHDIAYFQGALYAFGGGDESTEVYRVEVGTPLHDQLIVELGELPFDVIGAGARSCP
jgi:hypothetical protein